MADWSILIVGMLAVAAVWDVGRRYVDKIATRPLQAELDVLAERVGVLVKRVDELAELREEVAEIGGHVKNIRTSLESQKSVSQRRWPNVSR